MMRRLEGMTLLVAGGGRIGSGLFGRPDDIAAMSAQLMSEEGGYITGQVIGVDGDVVMR